MRRASVFVLVTFTATWSLWSVSAGLADQSFRAAGALAAPAGWIFLAGLFMPAVVAAILTSLIDGHDARRRLLRRAVTPPAEWRWFAFALVFMVVVRLAAAAAHRMLWGAWPAFGGPPLLLMFGAVLVSTPFQAGEEIGWRGYLLPHLASRLGRPAAAVLVGIVWAAWHLPLFLLPGTPTAGESFPVYLLNVTGLSIGMAWVFWRTGGSLLVTMLMHAAINNTKDIVPVTPSGVWAPFGLHAAPISWLSAAVLWALAVAFLLSMRRGAPVRREGPVLGG